MKQVTEAQLRQLLEDAYEKGAEDGYANIADSSTRDEYVAEVISEV